MTASTKDLIKKLRDHDLHYSEQEAAADALERLTQPVGVEPFVVTQYDPHAWGDSAGIWLEGKDKAHFFPFGTELYSAETVARLIAERDESLGRVAELWLALSDMSKAHDALQEQVKMLQDVLHANKDLSDPNCPLCKALAATDPKEAP